MSKLPNLGPSLQRYLRQQARTAQRQQQSSAFNLSGTSVVAEDVTEVDGTLNVVGNLNVSGPAVITGTLSLPAGIIDNAALASPVVPQFIYFSSSNFSLSTSAAVKTSQTVTVPTGFTKAVVSVTARIYAINANTAGGATAGGVSAGSDYLYCKATIDGADCLSLPSLVIGSGQGGVNVSAFSVVKTGLTAGSTFVISAVGNAAYLTWAADAFNTAEVSGFIQWYR